MAIYADEDDEMLDGALELVGKAAPKVVRTTINSGRTVVGIAAEAVKLLSYEIHAPAAPPAPVCPHRPACVNNCSPDSDSE